MRIWRACSSRKRNSRSDIDAGIHPLTYSIFVPMFFISIGLEANGRELGDPARCSPLSLVLVAIVGQGDRLRGVRAGLRLLDEGIGARRHRDDFAR